MLCRDAHRDANGTGHPHAGSGQLSKGNRGNGSTCQWIFSSHEHITMPSKRSEAKVAVDVDNGGSEDEH